MALDDWIPAITVGVAVTIGGALLTGDAEASSIEERGSNFVDQLKFKASGGTTQPAGSVPSPEKDLRRANRDTTTPGGGHSVDAGGTERTISVNTPSGPQNITETEMQAFSGSGDSGGVDLGSGLPWNKDPRRANTGSTEPAGGTSDRTISVNTPSGPQTITETEKRLFSE